MLRFGPRDGPVVIAAPALFEEGNRTRAFLVRTLRLLADRGIGSALPDLPGQGESLLPTAEARLSHWRSAFAVAAKAERRQAYVLALRGGCLLDAECVPQGRYYLSPVTGESLMRDLDRARRAAYPDNTPRLAGRLLMTPPALPRLFAGNVLSSDLVAELVEAEPRSDPDRTVRLDTDPRPADLKLPGRPLWRASEPDVDAPLAAALADDVAAWVRACAG